MATAIATDLVREMTDDSSSSESYSSGCPLIEEEAEEDLPTSENAVTAQDEAAELLGRIVGFGWCGLLLFEFEELLKDIAHKNKSLGKNRTVLCDMMAQLPTLFIRGVLHGALFSGKCYCTDNMSVIPPLLHLLMKRLEKHYHPES